MNYSQVGIANVALMRIGARGNIASVQEDSPNAIKISTCWDTVFQQVLSERDWKFAKIRAVLSQITTPPLYAYRFAYAMPSDYFRLVRPRAREDDRRRPWAIVQLWPYDHDTPVGPPHVHPYILEMIPVPASGNTPAHNQLCLLTDHNNDNYPVYINYIQLVTDLTQLTPAFVDCLAYRLAAELAVPITEDKQLAQLMMEAYHNTLNSASALNEQADYLRDEAGGHEWVRAGRWGPY